MEPQSEINKRRKDSGTSDQSFKSTTSSVLLTNGTETNTRSTPPVATTKAVITTTKADIEKLEQNSDRKLSAEIDAISAKLYHMNNVVKMNKDLDTIAKENLIQSDILKKLSMKEKWLADKQVGGAKNPLVANTKFEEKVSKFKDDLAVKSKFLDPTSSNQNLTPNPYAPKSQFKDVLKKTDLTTVDNKGTTNQKSQKPLDSREVLNQIKELINKENEELKASKKAATRTNSFKSNAAAASKSPLMKPKSPADVNYFNKDNKDKMEIENILGKVKNIEISKSEKALSDRNKDNKDVATANDIGKMLYKIETKFSPKPNKRMNEKLKEIEAKNFSGTLDSIKSQMEVPTVSAQAVPANVDLSKYFPNQQQRKDSISTVNKNQKALNEVDLSKYFPTSPAPQRRTSVVTVADRLKKSQTEKALDAKAKPALTKQPPKRQTSLGGASNFSLKDNQMDGAIDIEKMKPKVVTTNAVVADTISNSNNKALNMTTTKADAKVASTTTNASKTKLNAKASANPTTKVVTTSAVATTGKKGKNVKIIKKVVRKGSLKKSNKEENQSIIPRDEHDLILNEILQNVSDEMRSPSLEYQQLFQEERSPSDDLSDKIELILEETGIDLGISKKKSPKLLKAKSFGEGELQPRRNSTTESSKHSPHKEEGDLPSGVQNILKRFESMSSVSAASSAEQNFKLRRMESTTSNLNKSKESIVSRESDTFSDLDRTMEYLKSEWRNEATNFLQKKRNDFNKTRQIQKSSTAAATEEVIPHDNSFTEYKDSKYAKFFGFKQKSPERINKTPSTLKQSNRQPVLKQKTPEKKKSPLKKKQKSPEKKIKQSSPPPPPSNSKPIVYASLEELALVSKSEELAKSKTEQVITMPKDKVDIPTSAQSTIETKEIISTVDFTSEEKEEPPINVSTELEKENVQSKISTELITKSTKMADNQENVMQNVPSPPNDTIAHESVEPSVTEGDLPKRPLVEDIRNLPKTGCDKSLSSSRRGSQASIQSRRQSIQSFSEITIDNFDSLLDPESVEDQHLSKTIMLNENYDDDSLCTSISKSPSIPPVTVQMRGSSEDSIENLFSQFSDEMLVNVEFDSNDELIEIIPVSDKPEHHYNTEKVDNSTGESYEIPKKSTNDLEETQDLKNATMVSQSPPIRLLVPLQTPPSTDSNFPMRPKRRQKSKSSSYSSDSTPPLAPQRIKKKLSKLSPSDMPPSVQDLLEEVCKIETTQETITKTASKPLRFPRLVDEDDVLIGDAPIASKLFTHDNISNKSHPIAVQESLENTNKPDIKISVNLVNDGFGYGPNRNSENVTEYTKVLKPLEPQALEEEEMSSATVRNTSPDLDINKNQGLKAKASSLEWNMEMLPNSPMPRHKNLQAHLKKPVTVENLQDKKLQHEWDMEMLPRSPMPQRKLKQVTKVDVSTEILNKMNEDQIEFEKKTEEVELRQTNPNDPHNSETNPPLSNNNLRRDSNSLIKEKSPTSSIKLLNAIDVTTEDSEKRMIQEFELERRQSLIQRDKDYSIIERPEIKPPRKGSGTSASSSSNSSKLATPSKQSPRDSRRSSQQSIQPNRGGTPPMMKPLDIPSSSTTTTAPSSRRSSFAFIELLDNKPIIAPMPKKLDLPKIEDEILIPVNIPTEVPEEMKNRSWPKPQVEEGDEDEHTEGDSTDHFETTRTEYANVNAVSGPKRQWPDGRTIFEKNNKDTIRAKPRSETPEVGHYAADLLWDTTKPSSKSINDLSKLSGPYNSNYSLATAPVPRQMSMSSNESEFDVGTNKSNTPQRPGRQQRHQHKFSPPATGAIDANTQMLLERSKRLHDRKRDFVNERVVERNPYMKEVIAAERRNSLGDAYKIDSDDGDDDIGPSYRSKNYTTTRFPSSRALGRSYKTQNYDYVPTYADSASMYGSSRRLPTVTPLSSLNSTYPYKPYTTLGYGSTGRSSYLNDISSRRSPSQYRGGGGDPLNDTCHIS